MTLLTFAAVRGIRYGLKIAEQAKGLIAQGEERIKAEEIAEAILEQEKAKVLNFPRTVTINAQGKNPIKELVEILAAPQFKIDKSLLIMFEYLLAAIAPRGKPPDEWGNLILVALAEHLKKKTGRPHYALAMRTLRALRGQQLGPKRRERDNAKTRVSKFKRCHKDWDNLLKDLER
jgi:hypothetical protein